MHMYNSGFADVRWRVVAKVDCVVDGEILLGKNIDMY